MGNDQFYCGVRKAFPTLLEGSKPDLLTARIRSEPVEQTDSSAKSKHPLTRTTTSHRHLKVTTASVRSKFSMTSEKGASRLREVDAGNDNTSWSTARVYRTDEDDQAGQHPSIMPTRPVFASIDYRTKKSSSTATRKRLKTMKMLNTHPTAPNTSHLVTRREHPSGQDRTNVAPLKVLQSSTSGILKTEITHLLHQSYELLAHVELWVKQSQVRQQPRELKRVAPSRSQALHLLLCHHPSLPQVLSP